MNEQRHNPRRRPEAPIRVADAMLGHVIGQIGNLSIDGMMLLSNVEIVSDALYQFSFELPDAQGHPTTVEIGMHETWTEATQTPGRWWSGFRFIDLGETEERIVHDWLRRSAHTHAAGQR